MFYSLYSTLRYIKSLLLNQASADYFFCLWGLAGKQKSSFLLEKSVCCIHYCFLKSRPASQLNHIYIINMQTHHNKICVWVNAIIWLLDCLLTVNLHLNGVCDSLG